MPIVCTRNTTKLPISLYRDSLCLWNVKLTEYGDRNKRTNGLANIEQSLKNVNWASAEDIKKKVQSDAKVRSVTKKHFALYQEN